MNVEIRALTDVGLKRAQNEDNHASWVADTPGADPAAVLVVADGMGGAQAGEVASRMAVDHVMSGVHALGASPTERGLRAVVEDANASVHEESVANPERRGMGTTCTVVVVRPAEALFAHVGDSRAYLVRGGAIRQITRDHSLVAQLVQFQHLTPEEAKVDPRRNVVTRSLGVGPNLEVDTGSFTLAEGDTLLISSDGLHGLVEDDELLDHALLPDLEVTVMALVELAKQRGGHDNITVIAARFHDVSKGAAS